jgi:hypothetical protein
LSSIENKIYYEMERQETKEYDGYSKNFDREGKFNGTSPADVFRGEK